MTAVDVLSLIDFDSLLSDEERLIRDAVNKFVADRVRPHIAEWFEQGTSPKELAEELGQLGLLGMHLEGYGCAGTSAVSYGLACLELEAGDSGLRSFVSVQGSLSMYSIWRYGSEEQKTGVAAAAGGRPGDRLLRADRAGFRVEPGRHAHPGRARRRRLDPERVQDVDHQRQRGRRRHRLGPH